MTGAYETICILFCACGGKQTVSHIVKRMPVDEASRWVPGASTANEGSVK